MPTHSLTHSHRLRKTNARPSRRILVVKCRVPVLQKGLPDHIHVPLRRDLRPYNRRHAVVVGTRVVPSSLPCSLLCSPPTRPHPRPLQPRRQTFIPNQPRKRSGQRAKVEIPRVDREGLAREANGGEEGRGRGAGVGEEGLVAVAGEGDGEGVWDAVEDGVGGGGGREDEGRAGVDDGLAARCGEPAGRGADAVEGDLPVARVGDGDLGEGAAVAGSVAAAEAEGGAGVGFGGGAAEVETEFW